MPEETPTNPPATPEQPTTTPSTTQPQQSDAQQGSGSATKTTNNGSSFKKIEDFSNKTEIDYFNTKYADIQFGNEPNCGNYRIDVFLSPKYVEGSKIYDKKLQFPLVYNHTITSIILNDNLDSIGLTGYMDIKNPSSFLDVLLGRYNNFYVVINFTEYNNKTIFRKFEPYIFDISYVEALDDGKNDDKMLRIGLTDIVTSVLKTHSIASVIKYSSNLPKSKNYKEVFSTIFQYVKDYLYINSNKKLHYDKDLKFGEEVLFLGKKKSGYDVDLNIEGLVYASFNKISKNASIYEAMLQLLKDCCTSIVYSKGFSDIYGTIGDVLIPFFFKEEYIDKFGVYESWQNSSEFSYVDNEKESTDELMEKVVQKVSKNDNLTKRYMTMRDFYMPFILAFDSSLSKNIIYEDINYSKDNLFVLNGRYNNEITRVQFIPVGIDTVNKLWKNMIFLDQSASGTSGNCTLIYFSWFFDFFQHIFLNTERKTDEKNINILNVYPSFHLKARNEKIPHATSQDNSFENLFDEFNSYTYATETNDSVSECLRVMGKNIMSFIFINNVYRFTIRGDLFRRPNEIIRYGYSSSQGSSEEKYSMHTGLMMGDSTFLYVKKVTHRWQGNDYFNDIEGCKFCETFTSK